MVVKVVIIDPRGEKLEIDLCDTEEQFKNITVRDLWRRITERLGCEEDQLRLICVDKCLDDDRQLLSDYGVKHMSVIHLILRISGGGPGGEQKGGGMGDREGRNMSMEKLDGFKCCLQ